MPCPYGRTVTDQMDNLFRQVYTVSELTVKIKGQLEKDFPEVWVQGQISNFRKPASGHMYFALKDEKAQLHAVMYRFQNLYLRFTPEDGMEVLCRGRISVFEPRGEYQFILDQMEPKGIGALQKAFEQLKAKLEKEGLFDPAAVGAMIKAHLKGRENYSHQLWALLVFEIWKENFLV